MLLAIGFPTVFLILWLVIILGKGLVLAVNRYASEDESAQTVPTVASAPVGRRQILPNQIAAVVAAVSLVTGGKGKVTGIEKIEK